MMLDTLLGVGPVVVLSYRQSGFDPVTFSGLVDRYPPALTHVASGDLRVRCPIDAFPGSVSFGPPDVIQDVESGVLYDVVASATDLLGAARVFQLRRFTGLSVKQGTTQQNVVFSCESPVIEGAYLGGRFKWGYGVVLNFASIVCTPPAGSALQLTLEINGRLTTTVLTVPVGAFVGELDLGGLPVLGGNYVRWLCTGSPEPDSAAAMVYLTMSYTL